MILLQVDGTGAEVWSNEFKILLSVSESKLLALEYSKFALSLANTVVCSDYSLSDAALKSDKAPFIRPKFQKSFKSVTKKYIIFYFLITNE